MNAQASPLRCGPSLDAQVAEIENQLFFLRAKLPDMVARRQLSRGRADATLENLEAGARTIRAVRDASDEAKLAIFAREWA